MRNLLSLIIVSVFILCLAGCDDIKQMIEDSTLRTIMVYQDIHNSTNERNYRSVNVAENFLLTNGQIKSMGEVSVEELGDPIEVARLGIGATKFFVGVSLHNRSNYPATVNLSLIPNGQTGSPVDICSIPLEPGETLEYDRPTVWDGSMEPLHQALKSVFDVLDDNLIVFPAVQVTGGGPEGVQIDRIELCALPTYWDHEKLSADAVSGYGNFVDRVYDPKILGTITNEGTDWVDVRFYLSEGDTIDLVNDLLGEAYLAPGQTINGEDLLLDGADDKIVDGFNKVIDGKLMNYDYTIVCVQPIKVNSDHLRIEAKVDVKANIF